MIKHIVMWKLKEDLKEGTKEHNALLMKQKLEALKNKIPEIKQLEVGIDFSKEAVSYDIVLNTAFDSLEDLEIYQKHPDHQLVKEFVSKIVSRRGMVDYSL